MKAVKYILLFSFAMILTGIFGKSVIIFQGAAALLSIGLSLYLMAGFFYGILTLIKKRQRIEGGMVALSGLFIMGLLFKLQFWSGGGLLFVIGAAILLLGSVGVYIYTVVRKRKIILGTLYLAIGFCGLYFCFKLLRWAGASLLFIPAGISMAVAIFVLIKKSAKFDVSKIVLLVTMVLTVMLFASSDSQLFRFVHINPSQSEFNSPEAYHIYAWILYNEGKVDQAKKNLQLAIQEAGNPENIYFDPVTNRPWLSIERYQRAMKMLDSGNWNEREK